MKVVLESRKGGGNLVTEEFIVKLQTEFPDVEFKTESFVARELITLVVLWLYCIKQWCMFT